MADCKIYHNPRCSKSRQTLALLEEKGLQPEVVEYLKAPLTIDELKEIQNLLGVPVGDFVRKKEDVFKEKALDSASDEQLLKEVSENPVLLERPIVVSNGRAAIGRPPENILSIL